MIIFNELEFNIIYFGGSYIIYYLKILENRIIFCYF